jgi:hypothetical protein
VSELEHYSSNRSDRWQRSERGQRYEAWKQEWEGLDVTALDAESSGEFRPAERCPVYKVADDIAAAVRDKQRHDDFQLPS